MLAEGLVGGKRSGVGGNEALGETEEDRKKKTKDIG